MRYSIALSGVFTCALLLTGCPQRKPWQGITPEAFARANQHRILGLAHLENSRALDAAAEFKALQKAEPALALGYVNEAVALLNVTESARTALKAAERGAELLPDAAWPRVVLGLARRKSGDTEGARLAFEEAVQRDGSNPRVLGALLDHLNSTPGDHSARIYELQKALGAAAPGNIVAQSEWIKAQLERKDHAGASATLDRMVGLLARVPVEASDAYTNARKAVQSGAPDASSALLRFTGTLKGALAGAHEPRWTRDHQLLFGNQADPAEPAMREWGTAPPPVREPALPDITISWKEVTSEAGLAGITAAGIAPVAAGDYDLKGRGSGVDGSDGAALQTLPDLAVGSLPAGILTNEGGRFSGTVPDAGPASPLLVDLNNDFSLDLYAATPQGDRVFANSLGGKHDHKSMTFSAQGLRTRVIPAAGPGAPTPVDLDQDGDLDILRASTANGQPAVRYLRNNGNLTFTDLTKLSGLTLPSEGARQAAFGDFDGDGDPDVFVTRAEGSSRLFLNRRQDLFVDASQAWGLRPDAGAMCAAVADPDRDGDWDIAVAGHNPHGTLLYRNTGGKFEADAAALPLPAGSGTDWLEWLDYDNDTWLDLVVAGAGGVRLLRSDHGKLIDGGAVLESPATWVTALDHDQDGDLDLLCTDGGGALRLFSNEGGNSRPWIKMELQGITTIKGSQSGQTHANSSYALGATMEARNLWDEQRILITRPQTHVGLGRADRALAVRVTWTNNIPLNVIGPTAGKSIRYAQISNISCPFLYAWDGEAWSFACDFNWRSPLGMLFARGAPIPHDQTDDWVKLSGDNVRDIGGYYPLIATEELRELSYFDELKLLAVDHPARTEIYVDERFKMGPPAEMRIYTTTDRRLPATARNETGADLLPAVRDRDNVYTPVPGGQYRGHVRPHDLILDLGAVRDPADVRLYLNGWIFPAGTSTNVAAAQNPDVKIIPPALYVGDGRGGWQLADRNVGLPCGKRKTMVLDMSGRLVPGDYRVKLTTTFEIRWDHVFFTSGETEAPYHRNELPLVEAVLRERGYGTRYREVEDGPDLWDYNRLLPPSQAPDWPSIEGAYTKLGDCAALLRAVDDRYAIVGPGDELRMLFDGRKLPPLPSGWKRDFIFTSDGWTKDSEKNTITGEQVGPLPFHGMKRYPYGADEQFPDTAAHRAWQREWNTRTKHRGPAIP